MAFSVVAKWGEIGSTIIRICELFQWKSHPIFNKSYEVFKNVIEGMEKDRRLTL